MRFIFIIFFVLSTAYSSFPQDLSNNDGQIDFEVKKAERYLQQNFTGTIYKQVDFSELDLGANSLERARRFMGSDVIRSSWIGHDATIEEDHNGVIDTIWQCWMPAVGGSNGVQWYGKMKLNGTNYDADTLTYARFSYYIKMSKDFNWSNGGKRLGLYGDGLDNDGTGIFPAGYESPGCPPAAPYPAYNPEWGFTAVGGFDGPNHDGTETMGVYTSYHNKFFAPACSYHNYGEGWYIDGSGTTGDGSSETENLDGTFADNTWYKITIGIKLNSVSSPGTGVADGQMTWSRNDTCYGTLDNMIFRNFESITVDYWGLKTFFGGGDDPLRTEESYVYYDDLTLWADEDRTLPKLNEVETNVPVMPTPNVESEIIEIEADKEAPSIPSGIVLTLVTSSSLVFKWQSSTDNVGVDHYEIRLNGVFVATDNSLSYAATGLIPDTRYSITIRAVDEAGNFSPFSEEIFRNTEAEVVYISDNQAPTMPTGLKEQLVTNQSIELSWNPSTDNVNVSGYKIYSNNEIKRESAINSTTIEDLKEGLNYVISISAFDEAGNESMKSEAIQVVTINNDLTTNPSLPEVSIVDLQNNSTGQNSISEIKSLGYTELDDYGIMVTKGNESPEEGYPIFAENRLTEVESKGRVTDGLQLLYNFSDKVGNKVSEISGAGEPLDLHINRSLNTTWLPGQGLKVTGNTTLVYDGTSTRLLDALTSTNEITFEVWISQHDIDQNGPARIATISSGISNRAFMLGHEGNSQLYNYITRLNTTASDLNGLPELATSYFTSKNLHHVVYTRQNNGIEKIFVNGNELSSSVRVGDFSTWEEDYKIILGNELNGERPWNGTFYLVAIYNQALSEEGIVQNYESGFGMIRYATDLSELMSNITYKLHPFVRTDQGIVYGEKKSFLIENVLFSDEEDSLYMAVYPNPSNGDFKLHVEYENSLSLQAFIRIVNISGQIIFGQELKFNDENVNMEIGINLDSQLNGGIYSAILIVGTSAIARRFVIY